MKQQKLGEKGHLRATECHISLVNGVLQIPGEFKGIREVLTYYLICCQSCALKYIQETWRVVSPWRFCLFISRS